MTTDVQTGGSQIDLVAVDGMAVKDGAPQIRTLASPCASTRLRVLPNEAERKIHGRATCQANRPDFGERLWPASERGCLTCWVVWDTGRQAWDAWYNDVTGEGRLRMPPDREGQQGDRS